MSELGQKGEQRYLAVIGDLQRSREDPDRARTQSRLERALESLNGRLSAEILESSFIITLGDEFQGLLNIPGKVFEVITEIDRHLEGRPLRYGLGWGRLSTERREQALGMDGPCFHHAREAMTLAKSEELRVFVRGFGDESDGVLNSFLALIDGVRGRWKPAQEETVRLMRMSKLQREVAAQRGVSTSVISETLKSAQYRQILWAESAMAVLMNQYAGLVEIPEWREKP